MPLGGETAASLATGTACCRAKETIMSVQGRLTIDCDLAFVAAGVGFTVQVRDSTPATALHVRLRALEAGQEACFTSASSPVLADFVGGFCRWLGTKGVQVTPKGREIVGHFQPHHPVLQVLAITQEICQMLEDKFGCYPYTILNDAPDASLTPPTGGTLAQ
jgi:hypothetical protein